MLKDRTKRMFAAELERMLLEMPLQKVRVKDLCERCDVRREVFYYHFKDKYDLVAWIFEQDFRESAAGAIGTDMRVQTELALKHMWVRRDFYRKAFADKSQNSIERYIQDFDVDLGTRLTKRYLGVKELSRKQEFAIKQSSYGNIGCTIEWLKGDLQATPKQLAGWEYEYMQPFLREAYDRSLEREE